MSEWHDADIEALAGLIAEHGPAGLINSREGWTACICGARLPIAGGFDSSGYPLDDAADDAARATHLARVVLASDWLAERERAAAEKAWDEGCRAGANLGLGIGERVIGTRGEWPEVEHNPYTPAQPCACGSPETTSLKPGEVVTHTADACWIGDAEGGE